MSHQAGAGSEPVPGEPDDGAPEPVRTRKAVVRRAPRFRRFVWTGVVLALLVGLVLWAVWDGPQGPGTASPGLRLLWVEAVAGAVGAVLGAFAGVLADARSTRRSTR